MDGKLAVNTSMADIDGAADASSRTGLAYLLVPASQTYQAILDVLAADPDRPCTVAEVATGVAETTATVESRLTDLVGWGNVRRSPAPDHIDGYRAGAVRFVLTELGVRVWRAVSRTTLEPVADETAERFDIAPLLRLARRFDEASDAEARELYADAFAVPTPDRTVPPIPPERVAPDLSKERRVLVEHAMAARRVRDDAAAELRDAATELARRRLSAPAFDLLMELLGHALAIAEPNDDAYVADTSVRLELQLLHAPGTHTPLYGHDGVVTLDGFKVRLSALDVKATGGALWAGRGRTRGRPHSSPNFSPNR